MPKTRHKNRAKPKGLVERYLYEHRKSVDARHKEHNLLVEVGENQELLAVLTDPATGWYKKFNDGTTDLHLAAVRGDVEYIKQIFTEAPDRMLESTVRNESVLSWANYFLQYDVVRYLLANPAFVLKMELEPAVERQQDLVRGRGLLAEVDAQADCMQEDSMTDDDDSDVAIDSDSDWEERTSLVPLFTLERQNAVPDLSVLYDEPPVPCKLQRHNAVLDLSAAVSPAALDVPVSHGGVLETVISVNSAMLEFIHREFATLHQDVRSDLIELQHELQIQMQRINAAVHQGWSTVDQLTTDLLGSVSSVVADIQPAACLPVMPCISMSSCGFFAASASSSSVDDQHQSIEMVDFAEMTTMRQVN